MKFEMFGSKKKNNVYEFYIHGEKEWDIEDLLPYLRVVSDRSYNYKLCQNLPGRPFYIRYPGNEVRLKSTLNEKIKILEIIDEGVGKQIIEKYGYAIEDSEIKKRFS